MLLLKGGRVVNADRSRVADVLCHEGKIIQIAENIVVPLSSTTDVKIVNVDGKLLVPGGIDPHTHMRLPFMGTTAVDDFYTGTRAALAGGTTTIIDFVIPNQGQSLMEACAQWESWATGEACGDYAFHMAITWWSDQVKSEMEKATKEKGITSFKHFMAYKGALMLTDENLLSSFSCAKAIGAVCTVHAENGDLVQKGQQSLLARGITGPEGHPWSRPVEVEAEAVNRITTIAHSVNVPVYIVHTSCQASMDVIAKARSNGWRTYGEALAGHLTIDDSVYFKGSWADAAAYVMSPPFRPIGNQEALWRGLQAGILQTTATDNCTFCSSQKAMGVNDFTRIPNGTNGVEDRMNIIFDKGVLAGRITENEYVAITSTNAARIFGLYPQKGLLEVGSDADITVIDPNVRRTISASTHFQAIDHNIWEGWEVHGVPVLTVSHGEIVWEAFVGKDGVANWKLGTLTCEKGRGKYLPRKPFGYPFDGLNIRDNVSEKRVAIVRPTTSAKRSRSSS